ncbi:MAG TPA: hypothetical protein VEO94_01565, partial [Candidatus Dormibacteraeota bacterium]|nr:hypothetical protein [Candidatus Dormibacteraeota bacterium]
PNVLDLNRVCNADLPGTRTCTKDEIALSIPPPPSSPDRAWTLESATGTSNQFSLQAGCTSEFDTDITPCGQGPYLIACCGF